MVRKINFPVVGIGASAGGLQAFETFFLNIPNEKFPEMAFVLVQHLAPDHTSILSTLIQRCTKMKVFEVTDGMEILKNCIYIIPPNFDMALINEKLHLIAPSAHRVQHLTIDYFFRSLAQVQKDQAIGIILSGTGSDGTLGIKEIKAEGGMVMAQKPETCEFDGMPTSAIATGLVDFELSPEEMPAKLISYLEHGKNISTVNNVNILNNQSDNQSALAKIFLILRSQTTHDFSQYKPSTINRRIQRRMAVQHIDEIGAYLKFLQHTPVEVEALFRDILIGVTNYFRDPDAFKALEEQVIPKLFMDKPAGSVIRIWCAGCSTGEEAYSLAILIAERMEQIKQNYTIQIFATDIDSRAIATARAGIYSETIAVDVSKERLDRFFTHETNGNFYRIHKGIRDMIVFSEQDLIKDPPFSKLDLITCRNVLIYFSSELQEKLVRLFHFALNPGGMLFLGTSEGGGDFPELFNVLDSKAKIYKRKNNLQFAHHTIFGRFLPSISAVKVPMPITSSSSKEAYPIKLPLKELTEKTLLDQIISAAALVNKHGDILYLHGRSGMYLEPSAGETGVNNIFKMAREGLRTGLSTALHKSISNNEIVRTLGLRVKTNGHFTLVNLCVRPTGNFAETALYLIILEEALEQIQGSTNIIHGGSNSDKDKLITALEQELRDKDEHLMNTQHQLETSTQELKSSNEEMQSINEELQSTNEELETSKEELQSVNEELSTVNNELNTKVSDLSRLNNDMNNLLAGSGIATIFVDHKMHILRFTPTAAKIINLIPTDIGRPVSDIVSNLVGYDQLLSDTQSVLDTLIPKDAQVQSKLGLWYTMHIMPYRTLENVIEGAVLTFMDITGQKKAEEQLVHANSLLRLALVVRDSSDAICLQNIEDGKILAWNPSAEKLYGWSEAEAKNMYTQDRIPNELRAGALEKIVELGKNKILEPYKSKRLTKNGKTLDVSITATVLKDEFGKNYAVATTERVNGE